LVVGAVHLSVALPVVGVGLLGGEGLLAGGLLVGGFDPEEPPDELGGLVKPEDDPELPVTLGGLLVALAEGELEPEPWLQPERMSTAAAAPQSVFSAPMDTSSPGGPPANFVTDTEAGSGDPPAAAGSRQQDPCQ
jgi:hypothetical protein